MSAERSARAAASDHLLRRHPAPCFLLTPDGGVLAASPSGLELVEADPDFLRELRALLGTAQRGRVRGRDLTIRRSGWAFLVLVTASAITRPLARRQREIVELVAEGLTNPQIADRLGVKTSTVKMTLERLFRRAEVRSRADLVRWATAPSG